MINLRGSKVIVTINKVDFNIELYGTYKGKASVMVWNSCESYSHNLKMHYRSERTWDDHMGNTSCGYYVNLPLPNGKKCRCYLY